MPTKTREPGFYWVRKLDGWTVGEWRHGRSPDGVDSNWCLPGYSLREPDEAFQEIDERRIERTRRRTWRNERPGNPRPKT